MSMSMARSSHITLTCFCKLLRSQSITTLRGHYASALHILWQLRGELNWFTCNQSPHHHLGSLPLIMHACITSQQKIRSCNYQHHGNSLDLTVEIVWDAFFLNGLLLDFTERADSLELAYDALDKATCLKPALESCNERMVGPEQELWNHACEICCDSRDKNGTICTYLLTAAPW